MYPIKHRGGQGVLNLRLTPKIGHALAMVGVNEEDLLVITVEGKVIGIPTTQVRSLRPGDPGRPPHQARGQGPGLLDRQGQGELSLPSIPAPSVFGLDGDQSRLCVLLKAAA